LKALVQPFPKAMKEATADGDNRSHCHGGLVDLAGQIEAQVRVSDIHGSDKVGAIVIIQEAFKAANELFELGADFSNVTVSGCLGKAAVGVGVKVLLQCGVDIGMTFYKSRTQVLVSSNNHEVVRVSEGMVNVALGAEQVGSGLFLAELGLEGGKEGSGWGNEVFTYVIFVRSPFGSDEDF
jgi:hypothetical protein